MTDDTRVWELEDKLKLAQDRIEDLKRDRDQQDKLTADMREALDDWDQLIEQ